MGPTIERRLMQTRRQLLGGACRVGLGAAALSTLLKSDTFAAEPSRAQNNGPGYDPGNPGPGHFTAKAKRIIYLCQAGAPSQIDTFDYKPMLDKLNGKELPPSIRRGQRLTGIIAVLPEHRIVRITVSRQDAEFHGTHIAPTALGLLVHRRLPGNVVEQTRWCPPGHLRVDTEPFLFPKLVRVQVCLKVQRVALNGVHAFRGIRTDSHRHEAHGDAGQDSVATMGHRWNFTPAG